MTATKCPVLNWTYDPDKAIEEQFPDHPVYGDPTIYKKWVTYSDKRKREHLRWSWQSAARYQIVSPDEKMVRVWRRDGRNLLCDDGFMARELLNKNLIWQAVNRNFLRFLVAQKSGMILDVGANVGMNSVEYASWGREVRAWEIDPPIFDMLRVNSEANESGITCYNVGLGDEDGEVSFRTARGESIGQGRIASDGMSSVRVKTLDGYSLHGVAAIKIDVEGYERHVIKGAINTIRREQPILQWEASPAHLKRWGFQASDIAADLAALGYVTLSNRGVLFDDLDATKAVDLWSVPRPLFDQIRPSLTEYLVQAEAKSNRFQASR